MKTTFPATSLVYSTDGGRTCPACRQPRNACICRKESARPVAGGMVRVSLQTKGRGGKSVTLVRGLPLADAPLAALARQLRTACGSGGTVKDGVVEVQGDHADRLLAELEKAGFKAKRAGG
jgi:translation initiation factor 1